MTFLVALLCAVLAGLPPGGTAPAVGAAHFAAPDSIPFLDLVAAPSAAAALDADDFAAGVTLSDATAATSAVSYLDEVLLRRDSVVQRWPERRERPVRVWVAPAATALDGWQAGFPRSVRQAFDEWGTVDLPVRFAFVADSNEAEVRVRWVERFDTDESGRTIWWSSPRSWITAADIVLAMHASDGEPQTQAAIRAVALHEIGHVLGLDHATDDRNIMAPWVQVGDLSVGDRATASLLYTLPAGRLHD